MLNNYYIIQLTHIHNVLKSSKYKVSFLNLGLKFHGKYQTYKYQYKLANKKIKIIFNIKICKRGTIPKLILFHI